MSDSEEETFRLEEESMDEVHEIEDALQVSIDTNASLSPKRLGGPTSKLNSHSSDDSDSDSHENSGDDNSSSDGSMFERQSIGEPDNDRHSAGGSDSDEPPEIPGSPINQRAASSPTRDQASDSSSQPRVTSEKSSSVVEADVLRIGDDEEYEAKEAEQPRAMEFHSSSSSDMESEDEFDGSEDGEPFKARRGSSTQLDANGRPKTAARDLEKYRDAVPDAFFEQMRGEEDPTLTTKGVNGVAKDPQPRPTREVGNMDATTRPNEKSKFVMHVPSEVASLFSLVDAYTPEDIDIGTRLEPFLPEYTPAVGLPFDGIQIPRPDSKEDSTGIDVVRESSGLSNPVELELLMQVAMENQLKIKLRGEAVRSIDDAAHRPGAIDQWIASVAKAHMDKPLPQVHYKKPMPSLESLTELWPEEFEQFLSEHTEDSAIDSLAKLDLSLPDMIRIVCGLLDIPVYAGQQLQSLHVLFSLYEAADKYEHNSAHNS